MRTLLLLPLLLFSLTAQATLTLVNRETFQSVGTLSNASPGNLQNITAGSFYKRAGGPRLTGDTSAASSGWSADTRPVAGALVAWHQWSITNALQAGGVFTCWYYFDTLAASGANAGELGETKLSNTQVMMRAVINPGSNKNFWTFRNNDWVNRDSGIAIPLRKWFELRHSWRRGAGNIYDYWLAFRLAGSTNWTVLTNLTSYTMTGPPDFAQSGFGAVASQRVRYGMPSLYISNDYANDKTAIIADVVDPVLPLTWYVNPASGDDNNDGVTPGTAWRTPGKVDTESGYCGFFQANTYTNGDTLIVDTSGAIWDFQGGILNLRTDGLTVKAAPGRDYIRCKLYKSLANSSFTKVAGLNHTYSIADSSQSCVLWEDDKWMNHPTGTTWSGVSATVDATPGSFWTDDMTMYVHPFGDTDPTSDGKRYERSYYGSTIQEWGSNVRIMDIHAGKTCLAKKDDNDSIGGYCMGTAGTVNGTNLIQHCYFYYGSKHGLGLVADASNSTLAVADTQVEQCSPYFSQSPWVSYMTYATSTNNTHIYTNCTTLAMAGLIGSTNGGGLGIPVLLSHNSGTGINFNTFYLQNCNFPEGNVDLGVSTNCIVTGGLYGNFNNYNQKLVIDGARLNSVNNMAGNDAVVRNSIIAPVVAYANGSGFGAISTMRIEGCTIDTTGIPSTDSNYRAVVMRTGPASLIFRDNVFICKPGLNYTVFGNFVSTDTLLVSNNIYTLGADGVVAWTYNDGSVTNNRTFAQWKALGFDANTINNGLQFGPAYRAYSRIYRDAGIAVGAASDFSAKAFDVRQSCGAYEYVTPKPTFLMFHR